MQAVAQSLDRSERLQALRYPVSQRARPVQLAQDREPGRHQLQARVHSEQAPVHPQPEVR